MFEGLFTCLLTTNSSIIFNNKIVKPKKKKLIRSSVEERNSLCKVCLEKSFHFHWGTIQVSVLSEALERVDIKLLVFCLRVESVDFRS